MKQGQLIAVNGRIYRYEGIVHKVYAVGIDDKGILDEGNDALYLTDEGIENRGIELTNEQWVGLVSYFLRQDYDLTDEGIHATANDIVYNCFPKSRIPLVEELRNYIAIYMEVS